MKIFGLLSFLMFPDGGEGGGGGAVATIPSGGDITPSGGDTSLVPSGESTETEPSGESTAVATRTGRQPSNVSLAFLRQQPEHKAFANEAEKALAFRQALRDKFPGESPMRAIETLQRDLQSLAGRYATTPDPRDPEHRTGIQQIRDKLAELEEVDLLFYGADPKLFDGMTSDEEGKAAFAKLAPYAFSKFKQIAPKAYQAWFAKQFVASMKYDMLNDANGKPVTAADIPLRLQRLWDSIPDDNKIAKSELNAIWAYVNQIQALELQAPEDLTPARKGDDQLSERERRLEQREREGRDKELTGKRLQIANAIAGKEWDRLTKGFTVSPEEKEDTLALYRVRLNRSMDSGDPDRQQKRQDFMESGDTDGLLQYERYLQEKHTPKSMKAEVDKLLARKKPGPRPTPTPSNGTQQRPTPATPGFLKLNAKPLDSDLAYNLMSKPMVKMRQGVLRNGNSIGKPGGTRVSW